MRTDTVPDFVCRGSGSPAAPAPEPLPRHTSSEGDQVVRRRTRASHGRSTIDADADEGPWAAVG